MSIFEEFDVAISNGGLCAFVETNNGHDLYTHLTDDSNNLQALQNIAHCLHQGGLFIINIQGIHDSYDKHLPGKIVYSQKVVESTANKDCVEKSFYFKKDGHILAQQKLIYKIFKEDAVKDLFSKAGFKFEGIDASEQLFIYSKN